MEPDAKLFHQRLEVPPGSRLLNVGCGAGQLALIAARAGAQVSGCDITPNWLKQARTRSTAEGLSIQFKEGASECLPYSDSRFDVVASLIGAMYAPRPDELVADELQRVCKPGGKIAMANWTPDGLVGQMFKIIGRYIAPSAMPSPLLWAHGPTVTQRFGDGVTNLKLTPRLYQFFYPFPPSSVVDFYRENYGPVFRAFASLDENNRRLLRMELEELWTANNTASGGLTKVSAEYLEVIATRS